LESQQPSILYVDDDEQNLFLFRSILPAGYAVFTATSGRAALESLAERVVHVLFADQRMPEMSGVQLLERVSREYPDTIRVLVTGYTDIDVVIDAINRGAVYRYISKPWSPEEITTTVRNALEIWELRQHNRSLMASLEIQNRRLKKKINELGFLNSLMLTLREAEGLEATMMRTVERMRGELRARAGIWAERQPVPALRLQRPEGPEGAQDGERILALLALRPPERFEEASFLPAGRDDTLQLLPLRFRERSFGFLAFLLDYPADQADLLFAQTAAHVAASFLYGLQVRQEEMAKEKYFILGRMAGMIVHDLKGPMSTIQGFVNLLSRADLPVEERREYGAILQREVERLLEMIEELLSFSTGKRHLRIGPIGIRRLLSEVLSLYGISFQKSGIQVEVDIQPPETFSADGKKMKKVLINLLDNARDALAGHEGLRRIRIRTYGADGRLWIRVANSGPQIPAEILPRLFDPFFSFSKESGTGLGLTICRNIVEEHQGTIGVRSIPAETEFTIQLPAVSPPIHPPPSSPPA
jgi:signal transduction histidine kinase